MVSLQLAKVSNPEFQEKCGDFSEISKGNSQLERLIARVETDLGERIREAARL